MSRITQLNFIGQAHLLPGLSNEKVKAILGEQELSNNADTWTSNEIERASAQIMELCSLGLPEVIAWIAELNGQLEAREDGQLVVKNCRLPETLRAAVKFHKPALHKYVAAFPGRCWPTKGGEEVLNIKK